MTTKWKSFEWIGPVAPVVAAAVSLISMAAFAAKQFNINEAIISLATLAVTAAAGLWSVYLARAAKKLAVKPRIFISYSQEDEEWARQIRDALAAKGAKVWFDEQRLHLDGGATASIDAAIETSNTMVMILSAHPGPYVSGELNAAIRKHVPVVAIVGPGQEPPSGLTERRDVLVLNAEETADKIAGVVLAAN
jgi:ABC-type sugar transport system substrate-binding protein